MNTRDRIDDIFEVTFKNKSNDPGHGFVPHNHDVDYRGLRVMMRPSVFLKLAHSLPYTDLGSMKFLRGALKKGEAFGSPFLQIAWANDQMVTVSQKDRGSWWATGHEGRHRMMSILADEGDSPVEVHLFVSPGRARDITGPQLISLESGIHSEEDAWVPNAVEEIL